MRLDLRLDMRAETSSFASMARSSFSTLPSLVSLKPGIATPFIGSDPLDLRWSRLRSDQQDRGTGSPCAYEASDGAPFPHARTHNCGTFRSASYLKTQWFHSRRNRHNATGHGHGCAPRRK